MEGRLSRRQAGRSGKPKKPGTREGGRCSDGRKFRLWFCAAEGSRGPHDTVASGQGSRCEAGAAQNSSPETREQQKKPRQQSGVFTRQRQSAGAFPSHSCGEVDVLIPDYESHIIDKWVLLLINLTFPSVDNLGLLR